MTAPATITEWSAWFNRVLAGSAARPLTDVATLTALHRFPRAAGGSDHLDHAVQVDPAAHPDHPALLAARASCRALPAYAWSFARWAYPAVIVDDPTTLYAVVALVAFGAPSGQREEAEVAGVVQLTWTSHGDEFLYAAPPRARITVVTGALGPSTLVVIDDALNAGVFDDDVGGLVMDAAHEAIFQRLASFATLLPGVMATGYRWGHDTYEFVPEPYGLDDASDLT